ncbi:GAF domain-containing sensor histidine kinase [Stackebrandtia soli]|uniref:sensor histidine kinase n=1 Tax=Stackebrandtia soli TaxID=1892856 RepID=UPI0039ED5B33
MWPALGLQLGAFLLVLFAGLIRQGPVALLWCGLLAIASLPVILATTHPIAGRVGRFAEVTVVVVGCLAADYNNWLLPFIIVPVGGAAIFGGLRGERVRAAPPHSLVERYPGAIEAIVLYMSAAVTFGAASWVTAGFDSQRYLAGMVTALGLGTIALIVGHWLRQLLHTEVPMASRPYAEATALLTQLRAVARQLPGGTLDPGGIAADILEQVRDSVSAERAAVLAAGGGDRLVVLAQSAADRVDWETSLPANTLLADSWAGQQPHTGSSSLSRSHTGEVSALVVPLVADRRTVGLVLAETDEQGAYPPEVVDQVAEKLSGTSLRLETALLFDEVRSLATAEERQRLAREIHDGIAQELAMLGYGIDHALAQLPDDAEDSQSQLQELRDEVTRLVTELRLSLFELRSEVDRHGGLTTAIADYARTVGSSAGLRVHLSLDEGGARLPAATEAELLRIAQEAINNARKHARAENLWVTCEVDPPYARVEVADDGKGLAKDAGDGRYGLTIMSERAERIRGSLEIRPRQPQGTTVAVLLAPSARPGSVSSETARE